MGKKLRWGCIQPLTGGMYIGAYKAIGNHAEWILSFDGLDSVTVKDGKIIKAGNEYNLLQWLKNSKDGADIPYYQISDKKMFDTNFKTTDIKIHRGETDDVKPDYSDIDIVVAVPVCAGLSTATMMPQETSDLKNSNMKWITYYTLNVIKPKMYCFENAPTLFSGRGIPVRADLEDIAREAGYSVLYYRTNTLLHHNCQHRQRTFVIFTKWQNNEEQLPPVFGYEHDTLSIQEFFDSISIDAPQQDVINSYPWNYMTVDYLTSLYGTNWKDSIGKERNLTQYIVKNKLIDDFYKFIDNSAYDEKDLQTTKKYFAHVVDKLSRGMGYYGGDATIYREHMPAVIFKTIPTMMHPSGTRFCTIRECLSLMGMPEDFILYGDKTNLSRIGQNVPVNTAKFIVSQMVNVINDWDNIERDTTANVLFQDNIKEKIYATSK